VSTRLTLRLDERLIKMLTLFAVAPADRNVLDRALDLDFTDFEDRVPHEAARNAGAAAIVTRDAADDHSGDGDHRANVAGPRSASGVSLRQEVRAVRAYRGR
jgi:hypothetical protein